jgi:hypothetical protein
VKLVKSAGGYENFEPILVFNKSSEKQDIAIYNKLTRILEKTDLSPKQKLKTKIAIISEAMRTFPDGKNKLKTLMEYLIQEYIELDNSQVQEQ